jgi:ribosomal protein S1
MSEENFGELLEQEALVTIHNGEIVEGKVHAVKDDEIILDFGYKTEGIISKEEFSNKPVVLKDVVKVGDTLRAKVLKVNDGEGQVLLTYKRIAMDESNKKLEEAFNNKTILKGKVSGAVKGGLAVMVDEAKVFIPASLVSDVFEKDLKKYEGQEIEFVLIEFDSNPRHRKIIGDRKQLVVAEKEKLQKELFERIAVGMEVEGVVKNITSFGAFIDLGGADGLLHISEMSWGRVDDPGKILEVGQKINVLIKDIKGTKIALSLKFDRDNPWKDAASKYSIGSVVTGKVARMTDFGAFIELDSGIDALLHVSQIAREHVEKPSDVLSIGQEVKAMVIDFKEDAKKISLSIKELLNAEARMNDSDEESEQVSGADDDSAADTSPVAETEASEENAAE